MKEDFNLSFERNPHSELTKKLNGILLLSEDLEMWEAFYDFIVLSFKYTPYYRYGLSGLFARLKEGGAKNPKEMMIVYARSMYVLAKFNGLKIYGDDFNV